MCSPIRFTRPGARATRTGLVGEGGGGASNARANAAARGVEAMRVEFSLLYLQARAGVVILSERAERARAKDLLAVASRTKEPTRWTCWVRRSQNSRSFAPAALRMTGPLASRIGK